MSDIIIGIDLGTTNSEVAVVQHGRPRILGVDGAKLLPSVVGLADDGGLLVGQTARNQYTLYPERTIRSVKRRMGEDVHLSMGEQSFRPQEISALILKRLKRAAEEDLGQPGREGRDHGAGLLLRCPAPGDPRRRRAGGPGGRAHHQ